MRNEVEIGRLLLHTVHEDVISFRARLTGIAGIIRYRAVDEHGANYMVRPHTGRHPLTLGELVMLIETARQESRSPLGIALLAKVISDALPTAQGSTALEDSPTVFTQGQATMPGVLLGTAGYMSPQQARGKPIDKRSDIWSFGVVLFECLTGKRLFPGETVTDSIGALLHKEIDWSQLPPSTPPAVRWILRKCLVRDSK